MNTDQLQFATVPFGVIASEKVEDVGSELLYR